MNVKTETAGRYDVSPTRSKEDEDRLIAEALTILERRALTSDPLTNPDIVKDYLSLKIADLPYEVFGVVLLDNQHRVLSIGELFRGTIDGASVYPREVVREAILQNAAAVILYHNHPSGRLEESVADRNITVRLKEALQLVDVRVLDHFLITREGTMSFAEKGLI
jgi:DNA repair protein RadC